MKLSAKTNRQVPAFEPKAPDAIMADLWRTKRLINAQADYDVDKLLARVRREAARFAASRANKAR